MIGARCRTRFDKKSILRKARSANITSLSHAAAIIRKRARWSIKRSPADRPAEPGKPVHTRRGLIKRAILYAVDKTRQTAVIGPAYHLAGDVGMVHEHGGKRYGRRYEKRPFMGPALMKVRDKLPKRWADSVR